MSFLNHPFQPLESPLYAPTELLLEKWMHPDDVDNDDVQKALFSPYPFYGLPNIPLGTPAGIPGVTASNVDCPCIALAIGPLPLSSATEALITQRVERELSLTGNMLMRRCPPSWV